MKKEQKKPLVNQFKQVIRDLAQPKHPLRTAAKFERLYQEKHTLVFRHIYGLCGGSTSLAEDLTAETFMRAWQARTRFTGDWDAATGWLLRIARNLVIDHQRRGIEQRTTWITDDFEQPAREGLPEEELVMAEQQAILIALLQELPIQKREMITLRYLLEWRISEIADYLEIPANTVTVTIQRTLRHIRSRWTLLAISKEQDHVKI